MLDENTNCKADSLEKILKNWSIVAQNNKNQINYGYSDSNGNYQIFTDTGTYKLKLQLPSPYYKQACDSIFKVINSGINPTPFDLLVQKTIDCPYLNVNIANLAIRPCTTSVQVVNFCNRGSAAAQ